jgi:hypothetical protein
MLTVATLYELLVPAAGAQNCHLPEPVFRTVMFPFIVVAVGYPQPRLRLAV